MTPLRALAILRNGGVTLAANGTEPTAGYAVAVPGWQRTLAASVAAHDLARFGRWIDRTRRELFDHLGTSYTNLYYGLWHDTDGGEWLAEPAQVFLDREEAIHAGQERGQYSIYDLGNSAEIITAPPIAA